MSPDTLLEWLEFISFDIYDWTLVFAGLFLLLELTNDALTRRFSASRFTETLSSLFTQLPYALTEAAIFGIAVWLYFTIHEALPWQQPVNAFTAVLVLILADFTYYVEHYYAHKIRLLWLAHSVHHSSTMMNTATAFRFSIFDPVLSMTFHLPLVLMGFNPILILAGEVLVQAWQFWLHNEMVGRLGPMEWIFNTPSHHRVHHGSNRKYIDKNFGGILIIWDRLFGTFQKEEELPRYGLTTAGPGLNPIRVQFYEFGRLFKDLRQARSGGELAGYLLRGPGWKPARPAAQMAEPQDCNPRR